MNGLNNITVNTKFLNIYKHITESCTSKFLATIIPNKRAASTEALMHDIDKAHLLHLQPTCKYKDIHNMYIIP